MTNSNMDKTEAPDASPTENDSNVSPVARLISRVSDAFTPNNAHEKFDTETSGDSIAAIQRYLTLAGWTQGRRRVFEALPHVDSVDTVQSLRAVLYRLGFMTTVETANRYSLRQEYLPCFLRTDDTRIFIIESVNDDGELVVFDPSIGKSAPFAVGDIHGTLIFPEKVNFQKNEPQNPKNRWSLKVLGVFRPVIGKIFLLSFLTNLFALCPPVFVMKVYDKAIGAGSTDILFGLTVGIALIVGTDFAFRKIKGQLQAYLGARLDNQVNESAFRQLLFLPLNFTENSPVGAQLTRLKQMGSIRDAFTGMLSTAVFDFPFLILFIAVIAAIGGNLVFVPVSLMVGYLLMAAWAIPNTRRLVRIAGDKKSQLQNLLVESISAQATIFDLNAEEIWLSRHRQLSAEAATANMKARQLNILVQTISQSFVTIAGVMTLAIGVSQVVAGDLSSGALIAVMALSWRVLGPMRNIFLSGLTLGQTLQSIDQIDRLMRLQLERHPNAAPTVIRRFKGQVNFDRVSFKYPTQREAALRGVSFSTEPGNIVALCGPSGAGKSTVLRMMMGLYQQQAGAIFIDGLDIRQIDPGEWRQSLGISLEASDFFFGTVAQNIRLAHPSATNAEVEAISEHFGLNRYYGGILDKALETKVTANALRAWPDALKKRLSLSRAFIRDVPIYLLDNPSDNLDNEAEEAFINILNEKRKKSTILMSTHRPSHMRLADSVLWIEYGATRDFGPPSKVVPEFLAA